MAHKEPPMPLEKKLKVYRLSMSEYEQMKKHLGHEPNGIEWALYSALWSEHCSYKSSKVHLRKLFTKHPRVVQGPGENAGVIDLGQGERVAFKMESHNHPSFIEPTQGAATGVGGILRDIFTMGARPIACMDYLCFGEASHPEVPRLLSGVVKGVGGYGNCVGVPTVNGQTTFHKSYNANNLVNAFALGLFRPQESIFYGKAEGAGNLIVYVGARTGRDGVHGAAMASESFDSDLEKKKPNVQIGDPFFEKLLIEACLEVMQEKLVVGIQDMGAAGLTSSTFEMASRAQSGLKMDLKKVPVREKNITPEEILLSESQERMILVVEPGKYKRVNEIFKRWDLSCTVIGEITTGDRVELFWGDALLANVSHKPLVDMAPVYERPYELPSGPRVLPISLKIKTSVNQDAVEFLRSSSMTSRSWITTQYDQRVGAKTITGCEDGVALLRLPDSGRVLGMNTGGRPLLLEWDVETGARDALILPLLQMASRGVKALACTDCLNFGNPEKKSVMGQFVAALQSLDSACRAFDIPIISGNVSLYNETLGENIVPTPSIGLVGLREKINGPSPTFQREGDGLYLVRTLKETTWLGEFAATQGHSPQGSAHFEFAPIQTLQEIYLSLSRDPYSASQVISKGGVFGALVKLTQSGIGAKVTIDEKKKGIVEALFAERFYSAVWSLNELAAQKLTDLCQKHKDHVVCERIGVTGGDRLKINQELDLSLFEIGEALGAGVWRYLGVSR